MPTCGDTTIAEGAAVPEVGEEAAILLDAAPGPLEHPQALLRRQHPLEMELSADGHILKDPGIKCSLLSQVEINDLPIHQEVRIIGWGPDRDAKGDPEAAEVLEGFQDSIIDPRSPPGIRLLSKALHRDGGGEVSQVGEPFGNRFRDCGFIGVDEKEVTGMGPYEIGESLSLALPEGGLAAGEDSETGAP